MKKLSVKIITALLEADRKPSTLCKTINCSENDLNAACAELIQKKIIKKSKAMFCILKDHLRSITIFGYSIKIITI